MEGKNGMKLIFDLYPNSSFFYLQGLFPFTCYPCDLWSHRLRQLNFELSLHKTFKWSIEIKFLSPTLSLLIKTRNLRATFYFRYPEFSVSIVQGSEKLSVATSVKVLLFRIGEKEDSMVCVVM